MKKEQNKILFLFFRYIFIILISLPNLYLFYLIFTPLTIYPVFYISKIFSNPILIDSIIAFKGFSVEIISACIAGAAYYLLLALNLSIPNVKPKKRLYMVGSAFLSLLAFNILRILLLVLVLALNAGQVSSILELIHEGFWYGMNVLVVVGIWFAEVWIFKIKEIPVYTDMMFLYKKSVFGKSRKNKKTKKPRKNSKNKRTKNPRKNKKTKKTKKRS